MWDMWRVAARCMVLALAVSLAACSTGFPGLIAPAASSGVPSVQSNPTAQATAIFRAPASASAVPTRLMEPLGTYTAIPTFTATTSRGIVPTFASPTALSQPAQPTATATIAESVSLDKLPKDTVYKRVRLENQSGRQMDVSLHCTTVHGLQTVLEYESVRNLTVQAPEGYYIYVLYVGGRQRSGSFSLLSVPSVTITVYPDRVVVH